MYPIITKLGGRKFILAMYGITIVSTLFAFGILKEPSVYQWLLMGFAAIYTGGNTIQKGKV